MSNPAYTAVKGKTFDGDEDTLVGVVNLTSSTIPAVALSFDATRIFGFDGDEICAMTNGSLMYGSWTDSTYCSTTNPGGANNNSGGGAEGPDNTFSGITSNDEAGNVNFHGSGLGSGTGTFFSLEGDLNATFTVPADFTVSKSATPPAVTAGSSTPIVYSLDVDNIGGTTGTVSVSDSAPSGTTIDGAPACPGPCRAGRRAPS